MGWGRSGGYNTIIGGAGGVPLPVPRCPVPGKTQCNCTSSDWNTQSWLQIPRTAAGPVKYMRAHPQRHRGPQPPDSEGHQGVHAPALC